MSLGDGQFPHQGIGQGLEQHQFALALQAEPEGNPVDPVELAGLFQYLEENYLTGDEEVKKCIDVGFTESLFWQVPPSKAARYWLLLPNTLKDLYIDFHDNRPA